MSIEEMAHAPITYQDEPDSNHPWARRVMGGIRFDGVAQIDQFMPQDEARAKTEEGLKDKIEQTVFLWLQYWAPHLLEANAQQHVRDALLAAQQSNSEND